MCVQFPAQEACGISAPAFTAAGVPGRRWELAWTKQPKILQSSSRGGDSEFIREDLFFRSVWVVFRVNLAGFQS